MRLLFLVAAFTALGTAHSAVAQSTSSSSAKAGNADGRIAMSARASTSTAAAQPMRLACAPIMGKVFEANGDPLRGATLLIKGTQQVYVTDSEGKFQFTEPVYEGQILTIGAAGYATREIPLDDCSLPRLVLTKSATARIKRTGKRAGQVVRLNNRSTNLK